MIDKVSSFLNEFKFEDIHYLNEEGNIFSKIKTIDRKNEKKLIKNLNSLVKNFRLELESK